MLVQKSAYKIDHEFEFTLLINTEIDKISKLTVHENYIS